MGSHRRRYHRVQTEMMISVDRLEGSAVLAHSLDLSTSGIRFQCLGLDIEAGDLLRVQITLGERTVNAIGEAVWVSKVGMTQEVGLRFKPVEPSARRVLEAELAEPLLSPDEIAAMLDALWPEKEAE